MSTTDYAVWIHSEGDFVTNFVGLIDADKLKDRTADEMQEYLERHIGRIGFKVRWADGKLGRRLVLWVDDPMIRQSNGMMTEFTRQAALCF